MCCTVFCTVYYTAVELWTLYCIVSISVYRTLCSIVTVLRVVLCPLLCTELCTELCAALCTELCTALGTAVYYTMYRLCTERRTALCTALLAVLQDGRKGRPKMDHLKLGEDPRRIPL